MMYIEPRPKTESMTSDSNWKLKPYTHWIRQWIVGFFACTVIAVFLSLQWFVNPANSGNAGDWTLVIGHYLLICYVWGLLTIGIVAVTSRIGLDRRMWILSALTYFLLGILFSVAHAIISMFASRVLQMLSIWQAPAHELTLIHLLGMLQSNLILFTVIASICLAWNYYRKYQDRELRASKLESQLMQTQLDALKSQMQPHFLFNTLNAISALVRDQPEAAEAMIVRLSDLLRMTLDNGRRAEVTLTEELEFARRYLEIEKIRFGDRLNIDEQIEPGTLTASVPTLILQPIVENALKHGAAATSSECCVTIAARRCGSKLCLEVLDTGPGLMNGQVRLDPGLGISNTVSRLKHLYGDQQQITFGNQNAGGFAVRVEIPFQESVEPTEKGTKT